MTLTAGRSTSRERKRDEARTRGAFFEALGRAARVVRPMAWVLLGGTVLLAAVGLGLGWGELIVAAVVIGTVIVLSVLFLFGRTAYEISLDMPRTRVVVGERAYGSLGLANRGSRTIPGSRIILPVGPGRGAFDVPRMAAGEERDELFSIPTHARGVLTVGPVSVLRGDPLGLFERVDRRREQMQLFVHPLTAHIEGLSLGRIRDLEGLSATDLADDDVSFHALREYEPGDDLRHVHWKSTARTGHVMMRQYEETRRSEFILGLSTHPSDYADAEEFELAVSIAGSIGLRALADAPRLTALVPARRLRTSAPSVFLDELAGVEMHRVRGGDVVALGNAMSLQAYSAALAVVICGSEAIGPALRTVVARIPDNAVKLVITAQPGAAASRRRIGDADAVTVGALDDLPAVLRRVLG